MSLHGREDGSEKRHVVEDTIFNCILPCCDLFRLAFAKHLDDLVGAVGRHISSEYP